MGEHCSDVEKDRELGEFWERQFCKLASEKYGKSFTPHQIGRSESASAYKLDEGNSYHPVTLPDITIWSFPGEHHEIKHKNPTTFGCYGLEDYRLRALKWFAEETKQRVFYTVHDWSFVGRDSDQSRDEDWVTADVNILWEETLTGKGRSSTDSYVNGEKKRVPNWYWSTSFWVPLVSRWSREQSVESTEPQKSEPDEETIREHLEMQAKALARLKGICSKNWHMNPLGFERALAPLPEERAVEEQFGKLGFREALERWYKRQLVEIRKSAKGGGER